MEYKFTSDNFDAEVLKSDIPVMVDFYADWCGPCKMMAPVVEELAKEYAGKVKIGKLNVSEYEDIAARYRVMNIPTFLFFRNGQVTDTVVGGVNKKELKQKLDQVSA